MVLLFLVVFLGSLWIGRMIIKSISSDAEKKGDESLQILRGNTYDDGVVRKIFRELYSIAEDSFEMWDEYNGNLEASKKSILNAVPGRQDELVLAMNKNVKSEWDPRFKYLSERQNYFSKDRDLYEAFNECKKIDNGIQQLTLWNINVNNAKGYYIKNAKIALKCAAFTTVATIAVLGAIQHSVNKAGEDIGKSPKSNARYQDIETGNLYDEGKNRVPW